MRDDIARQLAAIKVTAPVTPEASAAVRGVYTAFHEREPYAGLTVTRDAHYGADERQRLDVFSPADPAGSRPVMLFVHGGAYVRGDKHTPGTPYHDNIAVWAARNGFIGVNMTYRLAPAHPYPAGSADVADALRWLHAHIAAYGGDPDAITLAGHSAGATHVACYAARTDLHARAGSGVNGLVLMSGNYEFVEPSPQAVAYFGSDPAVCAQASAIAGVVASELPTLLVISEFDSLNVHRQTKLVADAMYEHDGRIANLLYLPRHNHISMLSHLNAAGTGDSLLSDRLAEFIRICCARSAQPLPA